MRSRWPTPSREHADPARALPLFEAARRPRVEQLQQAALDSLRWFEDVGDHMHLDPLPFAVEAMTRSNRVDFEKLRQRDPAFVAAYERSECEHDEPTTSEYWNPKNETLPRGRAARLQPLKLQRLCEWAYAKSAFHRRRWDAAQVPSRPAQDARRPPPHPVHDPRRVDGRAGGGAAVRTLLDRPAANTRSATT